MAVHYRALTYTQTHSSVALGQRAVEQLPSVPSVWEGPSGGMIVI